LSFGEGNSESPRIKEAYIQNILSDNIGVEDAIIKVEIDSKTIDSNIKNIFLLNWNLDKNQGRFKVKIEYENNKNEEVLGRFFLYKEAYIASRNIKKSSIISEEDIKPIKVPYGKKMDIPNIYDIIGKQSTRNISFGNLISTNYLVNPIVVKERDMVEIIYKSSNIKLKTKGIAMKSGVVGDAIKVKNDSSGIIIHATIIDKGVVEIDNK